MHPTLIMCLSWAGRFHAFEIAHNLDRNSTGRGVRQFKTLLLERLERVRTKIETYHPNLNFIPDKPI